MGDLLDKLKYLSRKSKYDELFSVIDSNLTNVDFESLLRYLLNNKLIEQFEKILNKYPEGVSKTFFDKMSCIAVTSNDLNLLKIIIKTQPDGDMTQKDYIFGKIIEDKKNTFDFVDYAINGNFNYKKFKQMCEVLNFLILKETYEKYREVIRMDFNEINVDQNINIELNTYNYDVFNIIITRFGFEEIKYFYESVYNKIITKAQVDKIINVFICKNEKTNIIEWVLNLRDDINIPDDYFTHALSHDNTDLALAFYLKKPMADLNKYFTQLCHSNKIETLQWIMTLPDNNINIHHNNEEPFKTACDYGFLDIAQWLYNQGGIDITIDDDYPFRVACEYNHINIAIWLTELNPNYTFDMVDNSLIPHIAETNFVLISDDGAYIPTEGLEECPICLNEKHFMIKLNCGHLYCRECFTKLEKCPMCTLPYDRNKIILLLNLPK